MRILWTGALATLVLALVGCGSAADASPRTELAGPSCPAPWRLGWQRLAERVKSPVYCPTWMPHPLDGKIGGQWTDIRSVGRDGSYLISFIYQEVQSGEVHVNLRRYRGTRMPRCRDENSRRMIPCFGDPAGTLVAGPIHARLYTVGRDADQWHLTYLWHAGGDTFTVGEHVAPPYSYARVLANVKRIVRSLDLVTPSSWS